MTQYIDYDHRTAKLATINVQTEQKYSFPLTNKLKMTVDDLEIPPNATIRREYVKCGNHDCQNQHGPYLYAYWKQDKKLKKKYVGKNLEDFGP